MKKILLLLWFATFCALVGQTHAQTISIRVSVHVMLDPATGSRPGGISNEVFYTAADNANLWMANYSRGYRYVITEITNVGGPLNGGYSGPSKYYGTDFRSDPQWSQFQSDAVSDSRYRLRSSQINVYVATGFSAPGNSGGGTPIPPGDLNTAVQIFADDGAWWLAHELGHFFGLLHTFQGQDKNTCTPGDDELSDTPVDSGCWTTPDLAANNFYGVSYASLSTSQKNYVNGVYYNTMSYHDAVNKNTTESFKSEMQLDREADHANSDRYAFVTGHTRFVSTVGSDGGSGTSSDPYRTVAKAVTVASSGGNDILLMRPGSYNEQLTISKPLTIRAPRTGAVVIGH